MARRLRRVNRLQLPKESRRPTERKLRHSETRAKRKRTCDVIQRPEGERESASLANSKNGAPTARCRARAPRSARRSYDGSERDRRRARGHAVGSGRRELEPGLPLSRICFDASEDGAAQDGGFARWLLTWKLRYSRRMTL